MQPRSQNLNVLTYFSIAKVFSHHNKNSQAEYLVCVCLWFCVQLLVLYSVIGFQGLSLSVYGLGSAAAKIRVVLRCINKGCDKVCMYE